MLDLVVCMPFRQTGWQSYVLSNPKSNWSTLNRPFMDHFWSKMKNIRSISLCSFRLFQFHSIRLGNCFEYILYIYTDFRALLQQFKWNPCPIFWQKVGHILRNHIDPRVLLQAKLFGTQIHLASLHYSTATNVHWMWKYTTALTKRTNQPTNDGTNVSLSSHLVYAHL